MADEEKIILTLEANDEASKKLEAISKALRNLDKETGNVGTSNGIASFASKLESGINRVNSVTRHYNSIMSGFNRTVINGVREMGSAIYDFTSDSIKNFTDFSEQHAKTLGAMAADYDNTAQSQAKFFEDAQKLKDQAMQIGTYGVNGTGALMSVTDVSEAQTELIKAGVSSNDIVNSNVTADVLEFAQANDLGTSQAVEFAVTLGNQFDVKQKDWGSMLDKVSHTADMSVIEVADIVQSMKWAGGITSGLDRSLEETLGLISMLGDFGLKGSQAGTGIQALLTRLLTGDTTVITQAQAEIAPGNALDKFYEFEKVAKPDGNLLPMADVIDELNATMEDMTDEEQAWFAKKLFGLYQMKSAYALLNGDETDLNDIIKEIAEQSEGTNENKLELLLESQYGQLTSLNNLWEGVKTDVGDRLSPFVDAVRDELFTFLSSDGNYDINFDNLRTALDESCNLIEEKYGTAISNAVRGIGDFTIDLTEVVNELGPEVGEGLLEMIGSALEGDIFGKGGMFDDWGTMVDNLDTAVEGLPEDLQDLGEAVVGCIEWFGALVTLNVASEIAELISSVLQILSIAGGAVINVAGAVVVNGTGTGTGKGTGGGAGTGGGTTAGAGAAGVAGSALSGSTVVGSADDVAKVLGESADDITTYLGKQASYTIDDIARYMGASADDVIATMGKDIDDVIKAGAGSVDDIARGGSKLFGTLSKTGKALGILGTLWQIGSSGYEAYEGFSSGDTKGGTEAIGGGIGSLGGGFGGAALGTMIFPGVGTVIGAIGGSFGGDWLGREALGDAYDNFTNAESNYGTWAAGLPLIGGLWQKDGTVSQQQINATNKSERNTQEERYNVKPSDFGLPKVFDNIYDGKTGQIPWDNVISELQLAKDYPLTWGRKESEYGMDVDEAKSWQDSAAYKEYIEALNGAKGALVATQEELEAKMVTIKEGDANYDKSFDTEGRGHYSVWTGTQSELGKYLEGKNFIGGDPSKSSKGLISDPYMLNEVSEAVKNGITSGMSQTNSKNLTETGTISLTGDVIMPDISSAIQKVMPNGWAALSNKGMQDIINNQIQIDDTVTMQPQFTIQAPIVNVDVSVDKDGNTTKQVSILNPQQGTLLNNWYSRTSSQYGRTTK